MEIVTSWMEEGIRIGRQEARQEGKIELLLEQLEYRLGEVDATLEAKVTVLPEELFISFGMAMFDFASKDDVVSWVDQPK